MEKKIRKLIIGFFLLMLSFTMLSRAADSVMVAKVRVTKVIPGNLSYELKGTGTIRENSKKYVELESGYKISNVLIEEGQRVEKGDLLFTYDLKKLQEKKAATEEEYLKLQLSYQKSVINGNGLSEVEEKTRAKENAEVEVNRAKQALLAEKNMIMENKREEYEAAKAEWKEIMTEAKAARINAERAVNDAETELSDLMKPQLTAESKIKSYANALIIGDEGAIKKARNEIFLFFYKDAETYEDHVKEVEEAKEKLTRAEEDLQDIQYRWAVSLNVWDQYSSSRETRSAFYEQAAARDTEIKNAERVIEDFQKNIISLTQKDSQLDKAIDDYLKSIQQEGPLEEKSAYAALYQILYDNQKVDEKKISAARIKLARTREDASASSIEWEKKEDASFTKKEKLSTKLLPIGDGTFQFKEELRNAEAALENAKRALIEADYNLQNAKAARQREDKSTQLDRKTLQIDLDAKQKELDRLESIIEKEGSITSPVSGTVITSEIELGSLLTGQEKLIIATGDFELSMEADKEDMNYFSPGDEINIKGREDRRIQSEIEYIELPDKEGMVRFSAMLPEGDYQAGAGLDFEIKKSSENFPLCIPIQALRKDSRSAFILLSKESNSVLGRQETAFRLDVTVVSQDANTAAIDAALTSEELVIFSSNKNITEGDRVRVVQTE